MATDEKFVDKQFDRRKLLGGTAVAGLGIFGGGMFFGNAKAAPASGMTRSFTASLQELPADAAPAESQIYKIASNSSFAKVLDFYARVYERVEGGASDLFSESLVKIDKNFQIQPGAAESWEGSEDGLTWTFKIREGLMWSDGNPVTANDWVASFRNGADPEFAWDFTWFFQGVIANWNEAIAGEVPVEEIGVNVGANDYELVFTTVAPAPYIPAMLLYSLPLSAAGIEANGPLYNTDPATAISSGPYILAEWLPDQSVRVVRNEAYTGDLVTFVNEIQSTLTTPDNFFTLYQNDEIDYMASPPPTALEIMMSDEATASQVYQGVGDFATFYIFFDVTQAPFDDIKVRQAWSHAIDRDTLASQILGPNGVPAVSWLAPGFPAANGEGLKDIQAYDPELAKSLLAEAGFENGDGFPSQQLQLRAPSPLDRTVSAALAAMIKENLNIDVELLERDQQGFMADLTAKPTKMPLGYVRYGMDFFDPFNMLSVWLSGGRHSWSNQAYDDAVNAAAEFLGSTEERTAMFQDAERILVEDVPAVFVYHLKEVQFIKPWLLGPFKEADENGIEALHWPGFTTMSTVPEQLYIGADAPNR